SPSLGSGQGRFVAVSTNATTANNVIYSDDAGATWTAASFPANFVARGIAWSPTAGVFVASGQTAVNMVMRSADGITWTEIAVSFAIAAGVAWSNALGLFAFCVNNRGYRSADGAIWAFSPILFAQGDHVCSAEPVGFFYCGGRNDLQYSFSPGTSWSSYTDNLPGLNFNFAYSANLGGGSGRLVGVTA